MDAHPEASCGTCRLRKKAEGGNGNCRFTGVTYDIFLRRGHGNDCVFYDPRVYVPKAAERALALNPQSEGLF